MFKLYTELFFYTRTRTFCFISQYPEKIITILPLNFVKHFVIFLHSFFHLCKHRIHKILKNVELDFTE